MNVRTICCPKFWPSENLNTVENLIFSKKLKIPKILDIKKSKNQSFDQQNDENHQHQIIFWLIDKNPVFDAIKVLVTEDLITSQNPSPEISKVILR